MTFKKEPASNSTRIQLLERENLALRILFKMLLAIIRSNVSGLSEKFQKELFDGQERMVEVA